MEDAALVAGVTRAISEFEIYARHGMLNGKLRIEDLHNIYQRIHPVLHPMASNPKIVDLNALGYALSRLPQNICTASRLRLKRAVPKDFAQWNGIRAVPTDIEGRPTYDVGDGEIIMVIQEDVAEVLDVLSLLCCLTIECKKVRERIIASGLDKTLRNYAQDSRETSFGFKIQSQLPLAKKNQLFASLAFELGTSIEVLMELDTDWKGQLIQKMYEIATWDHDIVVLFHSSISKGTYGSRVLEWCRDVIAALNKLGYGDRPVHVICTDPQSVEEVLTSGARLAELQRTLRLTRTETLNRLSRIMLDCEGEELPEPDRSYYLWRLLSVDDKGRPKPDPEVEGIFEVPDRHQTGLRCRIIDVAKLDLTKVDPRLKIDAERVHAEKPILLHFGRMFGSQGAKIFSGLTSQLKQQVRSYSIVFLAGALRGGPGTILIPTYVIKDGTQEVVDFLVPNSFDPKLLEGLSSKPVLADGPVITVLGIVLQSREQLRHYAEMWKAIGVETIGAPQATALSHALLDGNLSPELEFRLAYVCTDNPIEEQETLAHNVRYLGVGPHSAVTIGILSSILG
jgi:hypothetical protein